MRPGTSVVRTLTDVVSELSGSRHPRFTAWGMSLPGDLPLPHDLVSEVAEELLVARRSLTRNEARVQALEALLETARALARTLSRPVTLVDLLATAPDPPEAERRRRLLSALRRVT